MSNTSKVRKKINDKLPILNGIQFLPTVLLLARVCAPMCIRFREFMLNFRPIFVSNFLLRSEIERVGQDHQRRRRASLCCSKAIYIRKGGLSGAFTSSPLTFPCMKQFFHSFPRGGGLEKLCPDELQHLRERERGVIVWFEFHSRQGEYYIKIIISTGCLLENNFPPPG